MKSLISDQEKVQSVSHNQCSNEYEQDYYQRRQSVLRREWILREICQYDYDLSDRSVFWIQSDYADKNILRFHSVHDISEIIATNDVITRCHQLCCSVCQNHNQNIEEFSRNMQIFSQRYWSKEIEDNLW